MNETLTQIPKRSTLAISLNDVRAEKVKFWKINLCQTG